MFSALKNNLRRHHRNYRGWSTARKIVVIESDDWGSIRMPSKDVYQKFLDAGIPVDKSPYCKYDSLATVEDLDALFTTLMNFKDSQGNYPVFTANAVMANPDFDKIRKSGYTKYHFEKFTDTLKRYPGCQSSFDLWREGLQSDIFYPQFHGREHINVPLWLKLLRDNHTLLRMAFDHKFWGLSNGILTDLDRSIQASYDNTSNEALTFQVDSIIEGLKIFNETFGYRSRSFIASNYIWDPALEKPLFESGVNVIQGMKYQILPRDSTKKRDMIRHFTGYQNKLGQIFLTRNCIFEPSLKERNAENVQGCLRDISNAFLWNKPAIITSHRLNFMGSLDTGNRNRNLEALSWLLNEIIKRWPSVEFMTSVDLGNLIRNDLKSSN